jgi:hypothetical protein
MGPLQQHATFGVMPGGHCDIFPPYSVVAARSARKFSDSVTNSAD